MQFCLMFKIHRVTFESKQKHSSWGSSAVWPQGVPLARSALGRGSWCPSCTRLLLPGPLLPLPLVMWVPASARRPQLAVWAVWGRSHSYQGCVGPGLCLHLSPPWPCPLGRTPTCFLLSHSLCPTPLPSDPLSLVLHWLPSLSKAPGITRVFRMCSVMSCSPLNSVLPPGTHWNTHVCLLSRSVDGVHRPASRPSPPASLWLLFSPSNPPGPSSVCSEAIPSGPRDRCLCTVALSLCVSFPVLSSRCSKYMSPSQTSEPPVGKTATVAKIAKDWSPCGCRPCPWEGGGRGACSCSQVCFLSSLQGWSRLS